jgi:hypothetical protein
MTTRFYDPNDTQSCNTHKWRIPQVQLKLAFFIVILLTHLIINSVPPFFQSLEKYLTGNPYVVRLGKEITFYLGGRKEGRKEGRKKERKKERKKKERSWQLEGPWEQIDCILTDMY